MGSERSSLGNVRPSNGCSAFDEVVHAITDLTISQCSPIRSASKADGDLIPFLDPTESPQKIIEGAARPNHNLHASRLERVPPWYMTNPFQRHPGHPEYTCNTCQHINLNYLFNHSQPRKSSPPEDYIKLGSYSEIARQTTCVLCKIVTATITLNLDRAHKVDNLEDHSERLLAADCLSPAVYEVERYGRERGFQLFLRNSVFDEFQRQDTLHTLQSHPLALRLITDTARGGRVISAEHIDFSWIKTTIACCELSTEMPPRSFDRPIRVIDTLDMSVVELGADDKYVALSYPWGKVRQFTLNTENEPRFRRPGGLNSVYLQLSRTIQDAMTVVAEVKLRYLWVDCLCIVQDNLTDVRAHMAQMGKIYRHAHFTIFAISGTDANYGLPGVRPGSRKLRQVIQKISGLTVASSLPYMEDNDLVTSGAWGSRAWTFQERFHSQRGLFIGDNGMIFNCWHIFSPEDEHCWHKLRKSERQIATGAASFFCGLDDRFEPYGADHDTAFACFAVYIYEYTQRTLTYQADALAAFIGIIRHLEVYFQSDLLWGLPEVEFDAALLWSPIGPGERREAFPSWSWLDNYTCCKSSTQEALLIVSYWSGTASYYWTHERDALFSLESIYLEWLDATVAQRNRGVFRCSSITEGGEETSSHSEYPQLLESAATDAAWFTSDDLCLPPAPNRHVLLNYWRGQTKDHLGVRFICECEREPEWRDATDFNVFWPDDIKPNWKYIAGLEEDESRHRLTFRALSAIFYVVGQPFKREELFNLKDVIWRRTVCDELGVQVGYIDIPEPKPDHQFRSESYEFVALSRSTVYGRTEPPPGGLYVDGRLTTMSPEIEYFGQDQPAVIEEMRNAARHPARIHQKGGFDITIYDESLPWCMFNVMMLAPYKGGYERAAIGRIHVDGFLAHRPMRRVIELT